MPKSSVVSLSSDAERDVSKTPNNPGPKLIRRGLLGQLRRILDFLDGFNIDQFHEFVSDVEENKKKMVARQQELEEKIQVFSTEIALLRQVIHRDQKENNISILDVKNLGYELGRALSERELCATPQKPGPTKLKSKICNQDDFSTDWLLFWCRELQTAPYYHRKIWEFCYICQALFGEGKLAPAHQGLGFGCGQEPLPSLFAKYGAQVTATDLDPERPEAEVWRSTRQHAAAVEGLRRRDICPDERRLANIEFQPIDMTAIPRAFSGRFDFCWSACALEHLGTLAKGLEFIENSLQTLKPGGVAVHTTEFTFDEGETIDNYPTVLYQSRHLVEFAARMREKGFEVAEYDFNAGRGILDRFIDLPPWTHELYLPKQQYAHLRLSVDGFACTSVGVIIRKPASLA